MADKQSKSLIDAAKERAEARDQENIKKAAITQKVADTAVFSADEGTIEKALTRAYNAVSKKWGMKTSAVPNILLVGGTGTGKTSRFKAWCRKRGINYFVLLASNIDPTDFGGSMGYDFDDEGKYTGYSKNYPTRFFESLNEEPTILFLDEFNRANPDQQAAFLTLTQERSASRYQSGSSGALHLENLLFTVIAINPSSFGNYYVNQMDPAMANRFRRVYVAPNEEVTRQYLTHLYTSFLDLPNLDEEDIEELTSSLFIINAVLGNEDIHFTDESKLPEDHDSESPIFSARSFESLLQLAQGDIKFFISEFENMCGKDPSSSVIARILTEEKRRKWLNDPANKIIVNKANEALTRYKKGVDTQAEDDEQLDNIDFGLDTDSNIIQTHEEKIKNDIEKKLGAIDNLIKGL
ncbi:MAG TPA: AAA domain-containing protein [Clostridiales bacterium]|nr:AAA domain-containing protein [Clostridiales bacterium]